MGHGQVAALLSQACIVWWAACCNQLRFARHGCSKKQLATTRRVQLTCAVYAFFLISSVCVHVCARSKRGTVSVCRRHNAPQPVLGLDRTAGGVAVWLDSSTTITCFCNPYDVNCLSSTRYNHILSLMDCSCGVCRYSTATGATPNVSAVHEGEPHRHPDAIGEHPLL